MARTLTFRDLKTLIKNAEKENGNIDNFVVNIIDATGKSGLAWQAHDMDYLEVDTDHSIVDIGFYT